MKIKMYNDAQLSFFPIYVATIDIKFRQDKITRPEGYKMHQIFLVHGGIGVLNIGGKSFEICENDLFYIAADVPHEYYGYDKNFMTSYISFCGSGFDNIRKYFSLGSYGVYKNKNRGGFKASVENLYEVFDTVHDLSVLCSLAFSTVIAYFDEVCKKEYSPIETVRNYIEENYSKMITLDDILTVYPYSKSKLCREFKEMYNQTIFDMLIGIRLRHAKYMINANPRFNLKDISASCGFNDISYFCKMYKRHYGCSPKG